MKESEIMKKIENLGVKTEKSNDIIIINISAEKLLLSIQYLHSIGFDYLATITAIDLGNNKCELIYNLYSFESNIRIFLKITVDYDEDKIPTVMHLWPNARFYERELYEMFGVTFVGNPDYNKPFILEANDPVNIKFPMRKSFDSINFSLENYGERLYEPKES